MEPEQLEAAASPFADDPEVLGAEIEDEGQEQEAIEPEDEIEQEDDFEGEEDGFDEEPSDDDKELSDEEIEELLNDLDDDGEAEEEVRTVPHAALHKERERRKEAQQYIQAQHQEIAGFQGKLKEFEDSFASVEKQLAELGLEDVVKLEKPQPDDPELAAYKAQQAQQANEQEVLKTVGDIREEASNMLQEYPMVSGESPEHEEIVLGLSLAAMYFGSDAEEATTRAMETLNKALAAKSKADLRQRKPARKKVASSRSVKRQGKKPIKVSAGNVKGVFDAMADKTFG